MERSAHAARTGWRWTESAGWECEEDRDGETPPVVGLARDATWSGECATRSPSRTAGGCDSDCGASREPSRPTALASPGPRSVER
jgi:hypothetical protein